MPPALACLQALDALNRASTKSALLAGAHLAAFSKSLFSFFFSPPPPPLPLYIKRAAECRLVVNTDTLDLYAGPCSAGRVSLAFGQVYRGDELEFALTSSAPVTDKECLDGHTIGSPSRSLASTTPSRNRKRSTGSGHMWCLV